GNVTGLPHRLRYLARTKESRFDGAEIPRGAFRVGAGQAPVAIACPAVEGLLVVSALLLGRAHRRHREGIPERFGREGAERLTLDEHDVAAELLDVALVLHRLE